MKILTKWSKPTDGKFHGYYAGAIVGLSISIYVAHIFSALTEGSVLWAMAHNMFGDIMPPTLLILTAFLMVFCGIIIIEGCLFVLPAAVFRQLLRWDFDNRWYVVMWAVSLVTILVITSQSLRLSELGASEIAEFQTPKPKKQDTNSINLDAQRGFVLSQYEQDKAHLRDIYNQKSATVTASYAAKRYEMDLEIRKYQELINGGISTVWAKDERYKWRKKKAQLKTKEHEEKTVVVTEEQAEMDALKRTKEEDIAAINGREQTMVNKVDNDNAASQQDYDEKLGRMEGVLSLFVYVSIGVQIVFNFLLELIYVGSGKQPYSFLTRSAVLVEYWQAIKIWLVNKLRLKEIPNPEALYVLDKEDQLKLYPDEQIQNQLLPGESVFIIGEKEEKQTHHIAASTEVKEREKVGFQQGYKKGKEGGKEGGKEADTSEPDKEVKSIVSEPIKRVTPRKGRKKRGKAIGEMVTMRQAKGRRKTYRSKTARKDGDQVNNEARDKYWSYYIKAMTEQGIKEIKVKPYNMEDWL